MKSLLEKALTVSDRAEVYQRMISSTVVSVNEGKIMEIEAEKKTEVALRLVKDNNMGTAIATDPTDETLIERALISLKHQKSEPAEFPNEPVGEVYAASDEVTQLTTEELAQMAMDVSDRLKAKAPEVKTRVHASKVVKQVALMNSSGFSDAYDYTNLTISIATVTDKGFMGVTKEYSGGKISTIRDQDLDRLLQLHRLEEKPVSLGNERLPVIFSGAVMGALVMRVLGGVSGGNVLKGLSPLAGKIGEQVFSEKITIRDDGGMPYGVNTMKFDDEGTRVRNTVIYENGVLKNYLCTIGQAKKLEQLPTGNAVKRALFSKEIEDAPAVFDTNMIIEGECIPDDEIIRGTERGLLITGVMGAHTGNINAGDFSLNISSAYLIEKGELVGKVKGSMIAGNIYELFKSVEAIGSQYEVMRSIFYQMGYSPMVKFSGVNIIGK